MDFVFRIAILVLGYFYPAYKCFKQLDCSKPKSEQLHVWCQYWIVMAVFTGCERVADTFMSWLPFYSGAKLAFVVYLWHPDTKGTEYVYQTFLKPLVSKHVESVDFNLGILRDETVRVFILFWTRLMLHVQSKMSGVLHQNAVVSPNLPSRPVLDGVPVYPSVPTSFYWSKMQQQRWPVYSTPGHQPLVTQSAIWADEEHKQPAHNSGCSMRSLIALSSSQQKRPTQPHHQMPFSQSAPTVQDSGVKTTASGLPSSTGEHKDNGANKEESDFELVHSNEVPLTESRGAATGHKSNIPAQGVRFRWWW